jgi:hypothetical protein
VSVSRRARAEQNDANQLNDSLLMLQAVLAWMALTELQSLHDGGQKYFKRVGA